MQTAQRFVFLLLLAVLCQGVAGPVAAQVIGPVLPNSLSAAYCETGDVWVSANSVVNWYIESSSRKLNFRDLRGLPLSGGIVTAHTGRIGESGSFGAFSATDVYLGRILPPNHPNADLSVNFNPSLGSTRRIGMRYLETCPVIGQDPYYIEILPQHGTTLDFGMVVAGDPLGRVFSDAIRGDQFAQVRPTRVLGAQISGPSAEWFELYDVVAGESTEEVNYDVRITDNAPVGPHTASISLTFADSITQYQIGVFASVAAGHPGGLGIAQPRTAIASVDTQTGEVVISGSRILGWRVRNTDGSFQTELLENFPLGGQVAHLHSANSISEISFTTTGYSFTNRSLGKILPPGAKDIVLEYFLYGDEVGGTFGQVLYVPELMSLHVPGCLAIWIARRRAPSSRRSS